MQPDNESRHAECEVAEPVGGPEVPNFGDMSAKFDRLRPKVDRLRSKVGRILPNLLDIGAQSAEPCPGSSNPPRVWPSFGRIWPADAWTSIA